MVEIHYDSCMLRELELKEIGIVVTSTFQHKWATPRQGQLTPDSILHILCSTEQFFNIGARVAIVWGAHLNVNHNHMKGKIKPPKLGGKSIGVFATRGVHRPSSIGLSFCTVSDIIEQKTLVVTGADMIVGTPIIAIHLAEQIVKGLTNESLKCPEWTTRVTRVKVFWSLASFISVAMMRASGMDLISGILSQDPRSIHSLKNHLEPIYEIQVHADETCMHVVYQHKSYGIEVLFVTRERIVHEFAERSENWLKRFVEKVPL